jgi:CheY-like chemotaxis protein
VRYTNDMGQKRALVVDDSKSARVILSRMLEKYDIDVDMAESAEQAIEYLKHDRPDAIFMDHLMPGMDGLQAVQAIKGNPQTAMIPIMMYTSQEGELYVGQARALGAMGVLPKQVRPVDVSKVLYELHLLPDRRDLAAPALVPVEVGTAATIDRPEAAAPLSMPPDWGRRIEAAIKQQSVDLRRFVVASLDSFAARFEADLRRAAPSLPVVPEPLPLPAPRQSPVWPWAALAAVCLLAGLCTLLWGLTHEDLRKARTEIEALEASNADLKRASDRQSSTLKDLAAALAASAASASSAAGTGASMPGAAGLPRSELVPYGELPFDRSRLDVLREVLGKLEAQGFRGVVKITSWPGLFCLSGNSGDGFAPAIATMPVNKCDLIGNPFEDSLSGQQRQSLAFANMVAGIRQRTSGAIMVVFDSASPSRATTPYPPRNDSLTAGEWNRVAAANNRVEFAAEPGPQ